MDLLILSRIDILWLLEDGGSSLKPNNSISEIKSAKKRFRSEDDYWKWVKENVTYSYKGKQWKIYETNECRIVTLDFNVKDWVNR